MRMGNIFGRALGSQEPSTGDRLNGWPNDRLPMSARQNTEGRADRRTSGQTGEQLQTKTQLTINRLVEI